MAIPGDVVEYNGHCFKLITQQEYWHDAVAHCTSLGGHMATSTSAEKNTFLKNLANGNAIWLGGSDWGSEGNWEWITGEEWSYTNWVSGQPDNAGNNESEDYLQLYSDGSWNDLGGSQRLFFICEWDRPKKYVSDVKKDFAGLPRHLSITESNRITGIPMSSSYLRLPVNIKTNYGEASEFITIRVNDNHTVKHYNGHTFKLIKSSVRWPDAKKACEDKGGHLATIPNKEKQEFIASLLDGINVWVGGTKDAQGNWTWITGEEWGYTNWAPGEPNNLNDEPYIQVYNNGRWNDLQKSGRTQGYVCEWDFEFVAK